MPRAELSASIRIRNRVAHGTAEMVSHERGTAVCTGAEANGGPDNAPR